MIAIPILVLLAIAFAAGFCLGAAYADTRHERDEADLCRDEKIAYLSDLVLDLHGPADWESQFEKEVRKSHVEL